MKIRILRDNETVRYAAEELVKYLGMMTPGIKGEITLGAYDSEAVNLGHLSDLFLSEEGVKDAMLDDLIDVKVERLTGYIAGSNDRSVLMGVYNYLKSAGCRWVRPGKLGEYIPEVDMTSHTFIYRKLADYPFRGECGEGACSFEHLTDTVLWLPKVNMNLFMIQQVVPYNFLSRWYRHTDNTILPHDDVPYEEYVRGCEQLERVIKKCGLQLHILGHGALTEPFGIRQHPVKDWRDVSGETKNALALVNGKRDFIGTSPFYSQFCLSQEWVRKKVITWIADFLEKRPHVDFAHFWLGDSTNNQCECEGCRKKRPSDFFVDMLNELDALLTERNNKSKIVFIIYTDTLWPPEQSRFNNKDRFIMVAACGTGKSYSAKRHEGGIPKWTRNDYCLPETGMPMTLTFIDGWRRTFDGPRFLFEYFSYVYHFSDLGYMNLTRWVINNMKSIHLTGFDGIMSCQTQRSYMPTGLPSVAIGEFLFDSKQDTEEFIDGYFADSFGQDHKLAREYLEKITATFDVKALTQDKDVTAQDTGSVDKNARKATIFGNQKVGDIIATTPTIVDNYAGIIEKNIKNLTNPTHKESWEILRFHGEYCKYVSKIYFALSRNDTVLAKCALDETMEYLSRTEHRISPYFDNFLFKRKTTWLIEGK